MAKKNPNTLNFDDAINALSSNGFEIGGLTGITGRAVRKYGCAAGIDRHAENGRAYVTARPGVVLGGEIAKLIDKGYQKFFKTSHIEVAATADHLKALHQFSEELKDAAGLTSLYNESLGTVSNEYVYDRVKDRDADAPPKRPWER